MREALGPSPPLCKKTKKTKKIKPSFDELQRKFSGSPATKVHIT
jgi:hypothetical protein